MSITTTTKGKNKDEKKENQGGTNSIWNSWTI